jgi:LPS export ABC transporter permease LptG
MARTTIPPAKTTPAWWRWLRTAPGLELWLCVLVTGVLVWLRLGNWHEGRGMDEETLDILVQPENEEANRRVMVVYFLNSMLPYLEVAAALFAVPLHLAVLRAWPHVSKLAGAAWRTCLFLAAWAVLRDLVEHMAYLEITISGEPPTPVSYSIKLLMIGVAALTPAIGLRMYSKSKLLTRHTVRSFLGPTLFCFAAFCSLWMLMDLLDSLKEFQENRTPLGKMLMFYINMVPFIYVSVAPAAILLGVLYALTKMSRTNEIVSMMGAGRSIAQILTPIFVTALLASVVSMAANYHWAPRAEGNRRAVMRALTEKEGGSIMAEGLMFKNPDTRRTWFAGSFPFNLRDDKIKNIELRQEDENGLLERAWIARSAMWWPVIHQWRFYYGVEITYEDGKPVSVLDFSGRVPGQIFRMDVTGIEETPYSIVSSALTPDYMGVPELLAYLETHQNATKEKLAPFITHLFHRSAMPFQCLVLALVAAPLGIAYSRRGSLSGVAASIFIFFGMMFVNDFFLNLGKGGHLAPWLTVWIPNLAFGGFGLVMLYMRSQNKEMPRFQIKAPKVLRPRNRAAPVPAS